MPNETAGCAKNCYNCLYRREVAGSAHSSCDAYNPLVRFHRQGVQNGWANYPVDFDPIWIEGECPQWRSEDLEDIAGRRSPVGYISSEGGAVSEETSNLIANTQPMAAFFLGFNTGLAFCQDVIDKMAEEAKERGE